MQHSLVMTVIGNDRPGLVDSPADDVPCPQIRDRLGRETDLGQDGLGVLTQGAARQRPAGARQ